MTLACAIVCEDRADRDIACDLADRVICESVEWIEVAALSTFRRWQGLRSGDEFLKWKDVPARAKACGIQVYGGFEGRPAAMDEHAARKAMLLFLHPGNERPAVILLIRDDDGHAERRVGMSNARDAESLRLRIPVVLGIATTKREAWVLAGLVPQVDDERTRLEAMEGNWVSIQRQTQKDLPPIRLARKRTRNAYFVLLFTTDRESGNVG